VRKRLVEIQYLKTVISDRQREEFGQLVENTIRRSSRETSCHTAAFVSRRTRAPAVHTWVSA
jgi:hypothetical protein